LVNNIMMHFSYHVTSLSIPVHQYILCYLNYCQGRAQISFECFDNAAADII
jgi:hypothetical protein